MGCGAGLGGDVAGEGGAEELLEFAEGVGAGGGVAAGDGDGGLFGEEVGDVDEVVGALPLFGDGAGGLVDHAGGAFDVALEEDEPGVVEGEVGLDEEEAADHGVELLWVLVVGGQQLEVVGDDDIGALAVAEVGLAGVEEGAHQTDVELSESADVGADGAGAHHVQVETDGDEGASAAERLVHGVEERGQQLRPRAQRQHLAREEALKQRAAVRQVAPGLEEMLGVLRLRGVVSSQATNSSGVTLGDAWVRHVCHCS